jgi:23S rRNA-/tRNA-specific pseudouridylate synthase
MEADRIGIPPTLMQGEKGERIDIEHWADGLLVFNKPSSLASKADPWYPHLPDLETAFNLQIAAGKPELIRHGITELRICNALERDATGAVLASITREGAEYWRNAFGSSRFAFHSILITRKTQRLGTFDCDLPLMRHHNNQRMIISHQGGKKTHTRFTQLISGRDADAWLASTRFPRFHQYRLHARECGIPMLRDPLYDPTYPPAMLEAEPFRMEWLHSYCVVDTAPVAGQKPCLRADPPKYWKRTLRRLGLEIDEILPKSEGMIEEMTLPIA